MMWWAIGIAGAATLMALVATVLGIRQAERRRRRGPDVDTDDPLEEAAVKAAWRSGKAVIATYDKDGNIEIKDMGDGHRD